MADPAGESIAGQLAALLRTSLVQIRKTDEAPPRASVIAVIAALTGKNANHSAECLRELTQRYQEINDKIADFKFSGQGQRITPVSDAKGIVEVVMLLGGSHAALVRRQAADLLVRYLGGDPTIVDEVCALRGLQVELAVAQPSAALRFFGEAMESMPEGERKRFLEEVRNVVRDEMQQQHVWSFSKRSRNYCDLMNLGHVVRGNALRELDDAEHLVRIGDFLRDRIDPVAWRLHGRKYKNIYASMLKGAKMRECEDEGLAPPVAFNQGEYRILYTEADYDLMVQTLADCQQRFEAIAGRDGPLFLNPRRGQRSIREFMQPRSDAEEEA